MTEEQSKVPPEIIWGQSHNNGVDLREGAESYAKALASDILR
jgi:hypothetical protein